MHWRPEFMKQVLPRLFKPVVPGIWFLYELENGVALYNDSYDGGSSSWLFESPGLFKLELRGGVYGTFWYALSLVFDIASLLNWSNVSGFVDEKVSIGAL